MNAKDVARYFKCHQTDDLKKQAALEFLVGDTFAVKQFPENQKPDDFCEGWVIDFDDGPRVEIYKNSRHWITQGGRENDSWWFIHRGFKEAAFFLYCHLYRDM